MHRGSIQEGEFDLVINIGNVPEEIWPEVETNCDIQYGLRGWDMVDLPGGEVKLYVRKGRQFSSDVLHFVTGNPGKVDTARGRIPYPPIRQVPLKISEDGMDVEEIARHKAMVAYAVLGRPVFVDDSGFVIPDAGGYPGHHVDRELAKDFSAFAEKVRERLPGQVFPEEGVFSYWVQALAYKGSGEEEPQIFTNQVPGRLLPYQRGDPTLPWLKSVIGAAFVPEGEQKTLAELTEAEYFASTEARSRGQDRYSQLLEAHRRY